MRNGKLRPLTGQPVAADVSPLHLNSEQPEPTHVGCHRKARRALAKRTKDRALARAIRLSLPAGIERDTFLMPQAIAESVCAEAERFLDEELPARYVDWLVLKTHRCYSAHRHFFKLMQARGNAARDRLYKFMRHWLASFLHLERPDLFYCLPISFGNGLRLPPGPRPRIHRHGAHAPLPGPRGWDEERVYRHFRWTWLRAARIPGEPAPVA